MVCINQRNERDVFLFYADCSNSFCYYCYNDAYFLLTNEQSLLGAFTYFQADKLNFSEKALKRN